MFSFSFVKAVVKKKKSLLALHLSQDLKLCCVFMAREFYYQQLQRTHGADTCFKPLSYSKRNWS